MEDDTCKRPRENEVFIREMEAPEWKLLGHAKDEILAMAEEGMARVEQYERGALKVEWTTAPQTYTLTPEPALEIPLRKRRFHRRFYLYRQVDDSGISGTGVVALGVQFTDGIVVIRWLGDRPSTVVWGSLGEAMAIHGHGGHTVAIWLDDDDAAERAA